MKVKFCKIWIAGWVILAMGSVGRAVEGPVEPWGAKVTVHELSLNASGFVSWVKLGNPGDSAMTVTCNAFWKLVDGTTGSVTGHSFSAVPAGSFLTISEAALLQMMGSPTQILDASIELIVSNPDVRYTAEKKASDGRLLLNTERVFLLEAPAAPAP